MRTRRSQTDIDQTILSRLKDLNPARDYISVRHLVDELSDDDIANMRTETQLKLLGALRASTYEASAGITYIHRVYGHIALRPRMKTLLDDQHRTLIAAVEALELDKTITLRKGGKRLHKTIKVKLLDEARRNWRGMTNQDRVKILYLIGEAHARAYGLKPAAVAAFTGWFMDRKVQNGYYNEREHRIYMNIHPLAALHNFNTALATFLECSTRSHQRQWVKALHDGKLAQTDPTYEFALVLNAIDHDSWALYGFDGDPATRHGKEESSFLTGRLAGGMNPLKWVGNRAHKIKVNIWGKDGITNPDWLSDGPISTEIGYPTSPGDDPAAPPADPAAPPPDAAKPAEKARAGWRWRLGL